MFFTDSLLYFADMVGIHIKDPKLSIILPMGISFYTFQATGYTIDVYRKNQKVERNFLKFTLFITFFPQLVAGPIERASNLMPQLFTKKTFKYENIVTGFKYMALGFFKKVVIADRLAACVNPVYQAPVNYEGLALIAATVLFAFQIYCDFSGYSDIAVGCSKMLGINLMQNFKQPFFSKSIQEFWTRWHVSLSGWFKDYVYFPLGGNKKGKARAKFNMFITFVLSGLWHGANWTYVLWGAFHGVFQIFSVRSKEESKGLKAAVQILITFTLFCLALIMFRANTVSQAFYIIANLLKGLSNWASPAYLYRTLSTMGLTAFELLVMAVLLVFMFGVELFADDKNIHEELMKIPAVCRFAYYSFLTLCILWFGVFYNAGAFIYFQF